MGQLAAFASLILEEEEAFWALTAIVEDIMTPKYYVSPLLQVHIDLAALSGLLPLLLPLHISLTFMVPFR